MALAQLPASRVPSSIPRFATTVCSSTIAVMSAAATATHRSTGGTRISTRWVVLATLIAVGAVLAMHGLGAHHSDAARTSASASSTATAPMAHDQPGEHTGSLPDHGSPASAPELIALCAVIVLSAATVLVRPTTPSRLGSWSTIGPRQTMSRPEPPVPRLRFAAN